MRKPTLALASIAGLLLATPALAEVQSFPSTFKAEAVTTNGTDLFVRVGGHGPAVVLLHGFGETGDMWAPLATALMANHTVIVPDLRGMGLSAHPAGGYDKATQARDIAGILTRMHIDRFALVTHDIGNMVGFALATQQPDHVIKFAVLDAPIPGIGPWDDILKSPMLWHFRFGGPDMERLVAGRERIYLDRFWNEFSANPARFDEASRQYYTKFYALPGAMHSGFAQFAAFDQDVIDNRAWVATGHKLPMPVLAIGGAKSFGPMMATVMRAAATDVTQGVVPDSGHWLMEEQPKATVAMIEAFLEEGK